jgi:hypothetical protein
LHDVVQLAGSKLPDRLRHSRGADDRVRWKRDLKRDIEYRLRNGLHFEPTRVSDELLANVLTNWKITPAGIRNRWRHGRDPGRSPVSRLAKSDLYVEANIGGASIARFHSTMRQATSSGARAARRSSSSAASEALRYYFGS